MLPFVVENYRRNLSSLLITSKQGILAPIDPAMTLMVTGEFERGT
jgi:hypothetical protein